MQQQLTTMTSISMIQTFGSYGLDVAEWTHVNCYHLLGSSLTSLELKDKPVVSAMKTFPSLNFPAGAMA
ncbi:MAG: hypothetical protein EBU88_15585 [Acidobacteria bacterium]|nr:hypothetical protein [Acidobacteriota bacterium]